MTPQELLAEARRRCGELADCIQTRHPGIVLPCPMEDHAARSVADIAPLLCSALSNALAQRAAAVALLRHFEAVGDAHGKPICSECGEPMWPKRTHLPSCPLHAFLTAYDAPSGAREGA